MLATNYNQPATACLWAAVLDLARIGTKRAAQESAILFPKLLDSFQSPDNSLPDQFSGFAARLGGQQQSDSHPGGGSQ